MKKIMSIYIIIAIIGIMFVGCGAKEEAVEKDDGFVKGIIVEDIIVEDIIVEDIITETIID